MGVGIGIDSVGVDVCVIVSVGVHICVTGVHVCVIVSVVVSITGVQVCVIVSVVIYWCVCVVVSGIHVGVTVLVKFMQGEGSGVELCSGSFSSSMVTLCASEKKEQCKIKC